MKSKQSKKKKVLDGMYEEEDCKKKLFSSIKSYELKDFMKIFEKCKNVKDIKNELGQNILMFAAENKKDEILSFLLEKNIFDINQQDNNGNTALILSAIITKEQQKYRGSMKHDINQRTLLCIELLLKNKANEEIKNKNNETFNDIDIETFI